MALNPNPKYVTRDYTMEDEAMLERAQLFHDMAVDDLAEIGADFPFMNAAALATFQTKIDNGNAVMKDEQVVASQKVYSQDVQTAMDAGVLALEDVYVYVELAYANDTARRNAFGQSQFSVARNDEQKLPDLMEQVFDFANSEPYKTALQAKGLTDGAITDLPELAQNIRSKNALQEKAKRGRPVATQDRVGLYNDIWASMKVLNICTRKTFRNNAVKLDNYNMYPSAADEATVFILRVLQKSDGAPIAGATGTLQNAPAMAAKTTDAQGEARWQSPNLPDALNVLVQVSGKPDVSITDFGVLEGQSNTLVVEVE